MSGRCQAIATTWLLTAALLAAGCQSRSAPRSQERELQLKPGPFAGFATTALGAQVTFDNDIYSAACFPLFMITGGGMTIDGPTLNGTILVWLHRAHVVDGHVYVQTCEIAVPFEASSTRINGYLSDDWFEATLGAGNGRPPIALRRLAIDGWTQSSDPVFCGRNVAFWSLTENGVLSGHVADLSLPVARSSTLFGTMELPGSDNGLGLAPATWSNDCSIATFHDLSGRARVISTTGR